MSDNQLNTLYNILDKHFDQEELRTLCFELGIDYDDLGGKGRKDKARELVMYLDRHNSVPEFVRKIQQKRPDISWDSEASTEIPSSKRRSMPEIHESEKEPQARITAAKIMAIAALAVALISLIPWLANTIWNNNDQVSSFTYQVQVQNQATAKAIQGAKVTIELSGGKAPLYQYTDSNGLARILIDSTHSGKPGKLSIEAEGYETNEQYMDLTEGDLPTDVRLSPDSQP